MKIITWFIIVSLFFASCGSDKKENSTNLNAIPNTTVLIFIDKTSSVDVSKPYIAEKYQQALNKIIEDNIKKAGDKLEMYYIHENTSKGRCLTLFSRTDPENTEGMNATDVEAVKTTYDLSIRRERNIFTQQATKRLMNKNTSSSNNQTDVLASLSIMADAAQGQNMVKVYYFSDMVESMKGTDRRDFQVKPPKNSEEAENWAKADAEKMKDLVLGNPEITMILPFDPMSSTKENNPNITQYWQKIFDILGVMSVEEL